MNQAIRYLNSLVYLSVRVKPNSRAGSRIIGVDDEVVELAVSAKPQDGEANKAVRELVADVRLISSLLICTSDMVLWNIPCPESMKWTWLAASTDEPRS